MPNSSALLLLIGPSASGKSTVARALADQRLVNLLPTWTTRPRRRDEQGGTAEHRFVDDDGFDRLSGQGAFLLEGSHRGLPYRYGLPRPAAGPGITMVILRADHVAALAATLGRTPVVYQICAPISDVASRLGQRGTSQPERELRLADYSAERLAGAHICSRTFVNDGSAFDLVSKVSNALAADFDLAHGGTHA
jgi:guanylate kinase